MDDSVNEAAANEAPNPPRQTYEAPQLLRHGTVAELTAGSPRPGPATDLGSFLP